MLTKDQLKGMWVSVPTEWDEDGAFDESTFRDEVAMLIDAGAHGIYTTGSTGEFYAMDWQEFTQVTDAFLAETTGKAPVQVGANWFNTRDTIRRVRYARDGGADAVQICFPGWMAMREEDYDQFLADVYEAAPDIALIHYNIDRTRKLFHGQDYTRVLPRVPTLIGTKAAMELNDFMELVAYAPQLNHFTGEQVFALSHQLGAPGMYTSWVMMNPTFFHDYYQMCLEGRREETVAIALRLVRWHQAAVRPLSEKGYPDLLAACELLHKEGRAFRLIVAGGMDDEVYWRVVQHAVSNDHLERFVTFLGHRDDTSDLLAAADAYVLPSRSEGLPLALLEAASAGLPIVATDVGDVGNVLDGDAGLLVEPGDPDALAAGMDRLLDDPKLREQLGRTASLRVRRNFGADTMAARYLELYERVAAGRRKDGRRGVIVVGPQTPTTGGMSAVVSGIWRTMTERGRQTAILNSGKTTPTDRGLATGVAAQLRLLWRVIRGIRRTRAKIVHIHTCSGWVFWRDVALATVAGLVNRRVVWHVHGGRFAEFAAGCGRPGRSIMRWAFESASAVIALSDGWRDRLRSIAPRAKWRVVPNGVPVESEMLPSSERFLFLGNLGPDKGAAELIAAAAAAKRQGCELHIDLAGAETAAGQRDSLVRAIAGGGLQHHVRLIGVVTGLAKHRALAGAGCLVQPSAVEAMPLSVLEAMAAGRAVIATDVGAVGEMIDNETEGLVIPPGDVAALAGAMTRLAGDADLRNRMGVAAWRRARRCYSEQVMADALAAVYDEVVN